MKRVQKEKVSMFRSIIAIIEKTPDGVFENLPGFMDYYVRFRDNMPLISVNSGQQMASLKGVAKKKLTVKSALVTAACDLSRRLVAFGSGSNRKYLKVNAHYAKTSLEQIPGYKTYDCCKGLLAMGRKYESEAGAFGITDDLLREFEALCEAYHEVLPSSRTAITKRLICTKTIGALIRENMGLLESMDILAALLQRDHYASYYDYFACRKLPRIGFRKLSVRFKVIDAMGNGLPKVTVLCQALRLKRLTYTQGGLNLKHLKTGIYEFEFLRAGYEKAVVVVAVCKGERKDVEVVLNAKL